MLRKNRLFTPGPTPLLPAAQTAMASFAMHHRTASFRDLFSRVLADVKDFIGTKNDVLVLSCSGSGVMEASISNLTSPGDKVLVLTAGKFGERWRDLAKAFGCSVEVLDELRHKLKPDVRAVFVQSTESSTGARHDVKSIAKLVRSAGDTLLVVDAITGLGTTPFDVDGWGLDIIIGGSQKALMIPPGLAYCGVSERAWKRMETAKAPRYYFDLRKERKAAAKGESAFTPATSLFAALGAALEYVREMGEGDLAAGRAALISRAEVVRSLLPRNSADGDSIASWTRLRCHRQGIPRIVRRRGSKRPGRDEGPTLSYRPPGLLRLSRYHWSARRSRARVVRRDYQAGGVRRRSEKCARSVC